MSFSFQQLEIDTSRFWTFSRKHSSLAYADE